MYRSISTRRIFIKENRKVQGRQGQDQKGPALFLTADLWYALSSCRSTYAAMDDEWGEMRK